MCVVGVGGRYSGRGLVVGVVFGWFLGGLWVGEICFLCECGCWQIWVSFSVLRVECGV